MNQERREKLREIIFALNNAHTVVDQVCDKEQDCVDNYPENLQNTEKYERMENAVDSLNEAMDRIEEAKEHIEAAIAR